MTMYKCEEICVRSIERALKEPIAVLAFVMALFITACLILLVLNVDSSDVMGYISITYTLVIGIVALLFTKLLSPKTCREVCKELGT